MKPAAEKTTSKVPTLVLQLQEKRDCPEMLYGPGFLGSWSCDRGVDGER